MSKFYTIRDNILVYQSGISAKIALPQKRKHQLKEGGDLSSFPAGAHKAAKKRPDIMKSNTIHKQKNTIYKRTTPRTDSKKAIKSFVNQETRSLVCMHEPLLKYIPSPSTYKSTYEK